MSDTPTPVSPTNERPQLCPECQNDLAAELTQAIEFAPQGKPRVIVTCPECGTAHAVSLTWTPQVVGVSSYPPDQIGPVPAQWTAEEILKREG